MANHRFETELKNMAIARLSGYAGERQRATRDLLLGRGKNRLDNGRCEINPFSSKPIF